MKLVLTFRRWILLRNKICFSESCINQLVSWFGCWEMGWVGQHTLLPLSRLTLIVCSWCLIDPLGILSRLQIILPDQFTHRPWGQRILARDSLHQRYPVKHFCGARAMCHSWATASGELVITLISPELLRRDVYVQAGLLSKIENPWFLHYGVWQAALGIPQVLDCRKNSSLDIRKG